MAAKKQSVDQRFESLEQKIQSIEAKHAEKHAELLAAVAELKAAAAAAAAEPPSAPAKKGKKSKKAAAEGGAEAPKKEPTAWNILVTETVAEMRQSGWQSWTDLKGVTWPGSRSAPVKDKKGAETGAEHFVYDGGEHDGKPPSPALGGMVRASYLKAQTDPEAKAKAEKYHAKLAEKRSTGSSVGSGVKEEPVADAPQAGAKKGRPKMTEEQKAANKLKREAKKSSAPAAAAEEFMDVEESTTPKPAVGGGGSVAAAAAPSAPKKAGKKALDLNFRIWEHDGQTYVKNERGDVLSDDGSEWVGRFNGTIIDEEVAEPDDLGTTRILAEDE
jgi:hypothetical protein